MALSLGDTGESPGRGGPTSPQSCLNLWVQLSASVPTRGAVWWAPKASSKLCFFSKNKKNKRQWPQPLSRPGTESRRELASPCDLGPNLSFSHGGILPATSKQPAKRRCPESSIPSYRTKNSLRFNKRLLSLWPWATAIQSESPGCPIWKELGSRAEGLKAPKGSSRLPPAHTLFRAPREGWAV